MDDIKIKRLNTCIKNRVNFISGTVSPAQSNKIKSDVKVEHNINDIELLDIGIKYMFNMYIKHQKSLTLSVQPKYMGSRLNMYLYREEYLSKSYCVTRNGFICHVNVDTIINEMHNRLNKFMEDNKIKMIIIDGELLPWSLLGKGLIEHEFLPVDKGLETEIELMEKFDFDSQLAKIKLAEEKYKIKDSKYLHDLATTKSLYKTYNEQMKLYAEDKPICYKPFGILKIVYDDNTESIPLLDNKYSQSEMYTILHDKTDLIDQIVIEITNENFDDSLKQIKSYFNKLTIDQGYEGIVFKPDYVLPGLLPMMKCRNTSYLTIIYGYDYMIEPKLSRLIENKTTANKIKQSIKDFELGMEMLKIKYDDIKDSDEYKKIVMKYLYNEEIGEKLDPRL